MTDTTPEGQEQARWDRLRVEPPYVTDRATGVHLTPSGVHTLASDVIATLRKQVRNAWAKLGCRCLFDDDDRKVAEDSHCPYHGQQQRDPDEWDPLGDLRTDLAAAIARAEEAERERDEFCRLHSYELNRGLAAEAQVRALEPYKALARSGCNIEDAETLLAYQTAFNALQARHALQQPTEGAS